MKKLIIYLIIFTTFLSAQVSDKIFKAFEGETIKITLNSGITTKAKLQKVNNNSVIIITENGEIAEVLKSDVKSIKSNINNANNNKNRKLIKNKELKNPWGPFALNFFIGFGLGSFIQRDITGGMTSLIGDVISGIALGTGIGLHLNNNSFGETLAGIILIASGSISYLIFRVYQLIRPFKYYEKQLALLRSITLTPEIAYNGKIGIKAGLNYKLRF